MDNKVQFGGSSWVVFLILWAILGYFVYGGIDGALGTVVFFIILSFATFLAFIPFIGIFVQYYVDTVFIIPSVFGLVGIGETWLTTLIFAISMIYGLFIWIIMTYVIVGVLSK